MKTLFIILSLVLTSAISISAQNAVKTVAVADTSEGIILEPYYFCPDSIMCHNLNLLKECSCFKNNTQGMATSFTGQKIVDMGFMMSVFTKHIVKGSCWNFVDEVYKKAGFPYSKRATIFKSKLSGPYADPKQLQPGDWLYHVNYSYNGIEHSAIFVCWKDFEKRIAITLGHVGQNLARSGVYGEYDLKGVYYITRPID
jgi:hypothetical protein